MTVRDNLIAAKALIDTPEKWAKAGDVKPSNGRYCAAVACNEFKGALDMFAALRAAFPQEYVGRGGYVMEIFDFNDLPTTTHADIIALFDRAITAQGEDAAGKGEQRTICEGCGNSNLAADRAIWTDDGSSFCPECFPAQHQFDRAIAAQPVSP